MKNSTLIDNIIQLPFLQCTRENLEVLQELAESSPKGCFVECGVAMGHSSAILLNIANKRKTRLYLCDSWKGFPKPCELDAISNIKENDGAGATIAGVKKNYDTLGLDYSTNLVFVPGFFEQTLPFLRQIIEPISFLHFDADFYQSAIDVLDNLLPKVIIGGIILFHDYPPYTGLKVVVEERFNKEDILIPRQGNRTAQGYIIVKKDVKL